ncbi:MAG: hypothetical protein RBT75_08155 [Anaerolineae bacterium]|nr:hypothetical protein [Anaerolineae bacterium]
MDNSLKYQSYLLRIWTVHSDDEEEGIVWRGSLESSRTGTRFGFASLDELFAFIRAQTFLLEDSKSGEVES